MHALLVFSVSRFVLKASHSTFKFWGFRTGYNTVLFANFTIPQLCLNPKDVECRIPNPKHESYIAYVSSLILTVVKKAIPIIGYRQKRDCVYWWWVQFLLNFKNWIAISQSLISAAQCLKCINLQIAWNIYICIIFSMLPTFAVVHEIFLHQNVS